VPADEEAPGTSVLDGVLEDLTVLDEPAVEGEPGEEESA
jgi:hypothetical protein